MNTQMTIDNAVRLVRNMLDDAATIKEQAEKTLTSLRAVRDNGQIRHTKNLEIGDYFLDRDGHLGVFCGCWGQNTWGRFLDTDHYGYVYPEKKLTHKEAAEHLSDLFIEKMKKGWVAG